MIVQLSVPDEPGMSLTDERHQETTPCKEPAHVASIQQLSDRKPDIDHARPSTKILSLSSGHIPLCLTSTDLPVSLPILCGTCPQNGVIISQDALSAGLVSSSGVPVALPSVNINEQIIMSSMIGPTSVSVPSLADLPTSQSLKLLPSPTTDRELLSPSGNYDCECHWQQCDKRFLNLDDLVNHVNDHHVKVERPDVDYQCKWTGCPRQGKGFNARYKMLIHIRTHTNEKPHQCGLCGKCFSRLENLKIHKRSHTGEKPYVCPFPGCNKAYSNSSDRFKHVRTHQEEKPYICKMPGCNKRYTDPSSLRKHVRTIGHYFRGDGTSKLKPSALPSPASTPPVPANGLLALTTANGIMGSLPSHFIPLTTNIFPVSPVSSHFPTPPVSSPSSHNPAGPADIAVMTRDSDCVSRTGCDKPVENGRPQDGPLDLSRSPLPASCKDEEMETHVQVD